MRHTSKLVHRMAATLATVVFALGAAPAAAAPADTSSSITTEVLADGIYLFRVPSALDYWTATNVVAIVNDDDVTVFDAATRASTARAIIAEIRQRTNKPVRTLINSHWHMDHWGGNDEFARAFPGLQIVATSATRDYMTRTTAAFFADGVARNAARERADLDAAIRTGALPDGTPLTPEVRRARERDIEEATRFADEARALPHVLPTLAFRDALTLWSGRREFRLFSGTGDASGSTFLYLPHEKVLVTGDVLVLPEDGSGAPPWTTNSYAITPWLTTLRDLEALDAVVIVPGQGPALHDKTYLTITSDLFASIIDQVHSAFERGVSTVADVQKSVRVDDIGRRYSPNGETSPRFQRLVAELIRKVCQESIDGVVR